MPIYQARRTDPVTKDEHVLYIDAEDIRSARAAVARHGWESARQVFALPPGFDIPDGAERIEAPRLAEPGSAYAAIARSRLIQQPISTIALGVLFGWILIVFVSFVVAVVLDMLGYAIFG
ncbi:MAG: hypothetical protein AAGB48_06380 [Planctomycetota bacterium]